MNNKIATSLKNTTKLKDMILNNPELPLIVFCSEDAYNEEFAYSMAEVTSVEIKELTVYKDYYVEKEEYRDELIDDLSYDYKDLSEVEYLKMIDKKMEETDFVKAIVIYVG